MELGEGDHFQSVILQRTQGVNNPAKINKLLLFPLGCYNHGAFDELVKYTYNSAMGYLGKAFDIKMEQQRPKRL